jgi:uncharacterized protein Yka (UPF0111/DUF47 family)
MIRLRRQAAMDDPLPDLLHEAGENIRDVSRLLRDLLVDYPEHAGLIVEVQSREHRGDRIARDIIHRLSANGDAPRRAMSASAFRAPARNGHPRGILSPADGHALATALDDIVDFAEQTADALGVYGVEAPMEQSVALAEVLVSAADEVARALAALGADDAAALAPVLGEIHRLESEGDRVLREGLACLFANGIDPMVVIRWKDIFESLESAVDACQTVAHLIEGISLKRGL